MSTPSGARSTLASTAEYVPRRPHDTVLYGIVREHLATFLEHAERTYATPPPSYVALAFEGYLACGDLARGFVRCHRPTTRLIPSVRAAQGVSPGVWAVSSSAPPPPPWRRPPRAGSRRRA